jgi:hypothetical protein
MPLAMTRANLTRSIVLTAMLTIPAAGFDYSGAQAAEASPPRMKCQTGPVHRDFGGTNWIVYSCDDQQSMVVISAGGSPASPFYFVLKPNGGTYSITGEGTGDKKASDAAGDALSRMTPADFATLLAETRTSGQSR